MKKHIITLILTGLVVATGAYAHGRGPKGPKAVPAPLPAELVQYDTNKDGSLSVDEVIAMRALKKAAILAKYDTDKDGKLSDAEKAVMRDDQLKELLAKYDADKDGKLSFEELKALHAARHKKPAAPPAA